MPENGYSDLLDKIKERDDVINIILNTPYKPGFQVAKSLEDLNIEISSLLDAAIEAKPSENDPPPVSRGS